MDERPADIKKQEIGHGETPVTSLQAVAEQGTCEPVRPIRVVPEGSRLPPIKASRRNSAAG
jgi:hypothetical protein